MDPVTVGPNHPSKVSSLLETKCKIMTSQWLKQKRVKWIFNFKVKDISSERAFNNERKTLKTASCFSFFFFWPNAIMALVWLKNAHFSKTKRNDHVTFHDATKLYGFCAVRIFLLYIFLFLILKLRQKRCVMCNLNSNGDTRVRRLNFPPTYFTKGGIQILCYEFIQI